MDKMVIVVMMFVFAFGLYYLKKEEQMMPPVMKSPVIENPVNEKMLELLELAFNQPLHDGDFTMMYTIVSVSAYTASVDECDGTPWVTANGTPSRIGLLAMSKDLRTDLGIWLGQTVALPPYGVFQIQDKMNDRHSRRVDMLHASKKACKIFGIKENVKLMWIPWDGKSLKVSMNRSHQ